ncbi:MAG: 50S ribosomal protein L4 [Candidatus Bathyarchaeota archaeon]|nr:50S ribosomal protein L4 [Candidatus Bathyarchaeota archaeon]
MVGNIKIPSIFKTPVRPDLVKKAVLSIQSMRLQPKGRDPMAGKRTTAESRGVGLGIARIPRVKGSGYPKAGQGAFAPGTVGGRLAHPPTSEKRIIKKINKKEKKLALKSAIAATAKKDLVLKRGHKVNRIPILPVVVDGKIEEVKNAGRLVEVLKNLKLEEELVRVKNSRRVRAGKGKMRGRRIKQAKGPLIVVKEDKGISKAAANIAGVDVALVKSLNAELFAPGTHIGRLTVWSEPAIRVLDELLS